MFGRRPSVTSRRGVVAAAHPLAAQAGARILSNGGNAFDAAVATAAALDVVEPYMSGLAGMGTAMVYVAAERRVRCLDFTPAVPLKFDSIARRYDDLTRGPHGVGPPASLAGWMKLLDTYGTRTTAELFADAIELARGGFPVSEGNAHMIGGRLNDIAEIFPGWSEIFLDNDEEPGAGWMLHQHDLADTYEALVSEGPDYLYHGALGQALVNEIQALGGALSMADLAAVEARWQDPIRIAYRDLEVNGAPPPSEGFQMLMTLGLVSHLDIGALERSGAEHLDAMIRAIRLSSRVRFRHANAPIESRRRNPGRRESGSAARSAGLARGHQRSHGADWSRGGAGLAARSHAGAHHLVLGDGRRRQRRVSDPKPRRRVRLGHCGPGAWRADQRFAAGGAI